MHSIFYLKIVTSELKIVVSKYKDEINPYLSIEVYSVSAQFKPFFWVMHQSFYPPKE